MAEREQAHEETRPRPSWPRRGVQKVNQGSARSLYQGHRSRSKVQKLEPAGRHRQTKRGTQQQWQEEAQQEVRIPDHQQKIEVITNQSPTLLLSMTVCNLC